MHYTSSETFYVKRILGFSLIYYWEQHFCLKNHILINKNSLHIMSYLHHLTEVFKYTSLTPFKSKYLLFRSESALSLVVLYWLTK